MPSATIYDLEPSLFELEQGITSRFHSTCDLTQTASMDHRHLTSQTQMSELDDERIWNHPQQDGLLNLGNGSFVFPANNVASNGVNPVTYFNPTLRANGIQSTSFSSEVPRYATTVTGTSRDPCMHLPSGGSTSQPTHHSVHHGSSYNQHTLREGGSIGNPLMDHERATYKRKNPGSSMPPDRGNRNGYYSAGSSSQCWHPYHVSFVHSHRNDNASSSQEGSQRNVRSRRGNAIHLEDISPWISSSSNGSHHNNSNANTLGAHMVGHWSHTPVSMQPNARVSSSEIGSFNHGINQSYVTSHATNNNLETDGLYRSNLTPFPTPGPSARGLAVGPSGYGQRTAYRANPSYPSMGLAPTPEDVGLPRMEPAVPPRYSTPVSIARQSNERSGRRNRYNRFQSFPNEENARVRQMEGVAMMGHPTLYDPMHMFDQHHGMRLDIDNMSYEELLALEERIGDVSTGLSEDAIRTSLSETIYCMSDRFQDGQDEDRCAICLEAYEDRDPLGQLSCKHTFHSSCITKWLSIKNVCPICKASALEDTPKGE
ncbi:probable E3 ubiquitin-protein ligase ZFP1 isoform X3 [Musa acuminata AAA Group]|uniref:probable E3 ubiquitin-protein ligase ZFP1 isoform X1 n=2 Tax=Musa acuminata AAA Group TaxID=214697 RepID=UPI0031D82F80